jgi:hypothetical protein
MEDTISISDMLRTTAINTSNFLNRVADHIDQLETDINQLTDQIVQLSNNTEEECKDENM